MYCWHSNFRGKKENKLHFIGISNVKFGEDYRDSFILHHFKIYKNLHRAQRDFSKFRNIKSMTEPVIILSIPDYKQIIRRNTNSISSSHIMKISRIRDKSKSKYSLYICIDQVLLFQADFLLSRTLLMALTEFFVLHNLHHYMPKKVH